MLPPELPELLRRVRGASGDLPIAVGFGIANRPTAAAVAEAADGFVVGSALADVVERAMDEGVDVVEAARAFVRAVDPRGPKGPRSARQI